MTLDPAVDPAVDLARSWTDALRPGADPDQVLAGLCRAARAAACAAGSAPPAVDPPDDDGSLGARMARHAAELVRRGAALPAALDDALVLALHAGEAAALRAAPGGDPAADPAGVQALAQRWHDYPARILDGLPERPNALRNPRRNLQVMVTRRCQLRCSYCPVVKGELDAPPEVLDAAANLLLGGDGPDLRLDFSGGEPLLRFGEVLRVAERFHDEALARGKRPSFYLVTNGFELTPEVARRLAGLGFRVELSLDGDQATHNRNKVPLDPADNPYRCTRRAIEAARSEGLPHTVVMVATPDTVATLRNSFEHALEIGVRSVDINYAIGREWDPAALGTFLGVLEAVARDHATALADGTLTLGNLSSKVEPAVLNAEWMVDTDGSLHLMTEWALESRRPPGEPDHSWGTVTEPRAWDELYAGRFHAYLTLLQAYSWRDGRLRRVLHDNIRAGRSVARHLAASWSRP